MQFSKFILRDVYRQSRIKDELKCWFGEKNRGKKPSFDVFIKVFFEKFTEKMFKFVSLSLVMRFCQHIFVSSTWSWLLFRLSYIWITFVTWQVSRRTVPISGCSCPGPCLNTWNSSLGNYLPKFYIWILIVTMTLYIHCRVLAPKRLFVIVWKCFSL